MGGVLRYAPPWLMSAFDYLPSKAMIKLRRNRELVADMARGLVQSSTDAMLRGVEGGKDILSLIVQANLASEKQKRMSSQEVYAQVSSFMLAGEETVANSVCWSLYELCMNPEYQSRIRLEINDVYSEASGRGDNDLTFGDLEKMTLLVAFIKEVLRFHPTLPISLRAAAIDTVVPLGQPIVTNTGKVLKEVPVREGQVIIIDSAGYNRLESVWGTDATLFDPNRWLEERKGAQASYSGMYANLMTFFGGARGCIGWRFALAEMQVFLIELLRNFQFSLPPGVEIMRELALVTIPVVRGDESRRQLLPLIVTPEV